MHRVFFNAAVWMCLLFILFAAYAPAIQNYFLSFDDYFFLWTNGFEKDLFSISALGNISDARFIYGFVEYVHFIYINSLRSLEATRAIRFEGLLGASLLAYVIFLILRAHRFKSEHAFLISVLICTLPSFLVFISYILSISHFYSALFSALASLLVFKYVWSGKKRSGAAVMIAILCLVIAQALYQPAAMMYWSMAIIPAVVLREEDFRGKWLRPFVTYLAVGLTAMAAYWGVVKTLIFAMGLNINSRAEFITLSDIPGKLKFFIMFASKNALNLWNIFPEKILLFPVSAIIVAGIIYNPTEKENKLVSPLNFLRKLFLVSGFTVLSYLPNLLVREGSWPEYRNIVSLATASCILFSYGIIGLTGLTGFFRKYSFRIRRIVVTAILFLLAITTCFLANNNINQYIVTVQIDELNYIKGVIRGYGGISGLSDISKIYVVNPRSHLSEDKRLLFEFGRLSSSASYTAVSMVGLALYELGITGNIPILMLPSGEPLPGGENILIIDMMKFKLDSML